MGNDVLEEDGLAHRQTTFSPKLLSRQGLRFDYRS